MVKRRFSALFLTLTLLLCTLPAAAAEGDDWLIPRMRDYAAATVTAESTDPVDMAAAAEMLDTPGSL